MGIKNIYIIIFLISIILIIFFAWQNNSIVITNYQYKTPKVPKGFDGFKILQVSDLHNKNFHGRLSKKIKESAPDIIVISGDLIDRRKTRVDIAIEFIKEIIEIAPIYYVSGNHEQISEEYGTLKKELKNLNVEILDNSYIELKYNGDKIGLMGMADPAILLNRGNYTSKDNVDYTLSTLRKILKNTDTEFNILLSHRPELFNVYKALKIDLTFSGHAHGGQIRIPFLGGILSPNQGFFPKYSEGMIVEDEATMVVSRGLGNSIFPFRVFNRPELIVVELKNK